MMLRKLAVSLALAGILSTSNAYALGLGAIKINSALNEPLDAEIQLLEARKLNPLQIQPRMADIDEYVLAGVDKQRFLSDVSFKVFVGPDGNGRIRLTSPNPIKEPFLNFLVELNWPNGRLVREYTLLLDPPVYNPVRQRLAAQPSIPPRVQPALAEPVRQVAPVQNIRTEVDRQRQVFVDVHDSLWGIADKHRPGESVTKSQMALALLKKNPDAFVDQNINHMKAGVVLNLPTLGEVNALTPQQAAAEVQRQNRQWKNRNQKPVQRAKPLVATVKPKKPVAPVKPVAEVKPVIADKPLIVAAQPIATQAEAAGSDSEAIKALEDVRTALEQELDATNGELTELRADNELLKDQLSKIQTQLTAIQSTLDGKDRTIAELEAIIEEQRDRLNVKEQGFFDKLMGDPVLLASIGGGLIAILIAVLLLVFLRRRKAKKADDESDTDLAAAAAMGAAAVVAADAVAGDSDAEVVEPADAEADIADISVDDNMDDLSDLDLDMDLDLDLDLDVDSGESGAGDADDELDALLEDDEFDLGLDESDAAGDIVESVTTNVVEDDVDDAELEKLLAEDLGEDLAGSSLDLDADLDDADLEFSAGGGAVAGESDALDDILGADDDTALEFTPPSMDADDGDEVEFDLEGMGLDDLGSDLSGTDDLDFDVGDDLDADDLLSVASDSGIEKDVAADDIDALLAQASQDIESSAELAVDEPVVEASLDDDLDTSALDADLEALLAETEQVADETEVQSEEKDEDLDIDDLLASVNADSELEETTVSEALESEPFDVLMSSSEDTSSQEEDLDIDDIDALLSEVSLGNDLPESKPEVAQAEAVIEDIDDILADVQGEDSDVDVLMQDLSDLALDEPEEVAAVGDLTADEDELSVDDDLDALLAEVAGIEPETETALDLELDEELADLELDADAFVAELDVDAAPVVEALDTTEDLTDDLDALLEQAAVSVPEVTEEPSEPQVQSDADFDAEIESLLNEVVEKTEPQSEPEIDLEDELAGFDLDEMLDLAPDQDLMADAIVEPLDVEELASESESTAPEMSAQIDELDTPLDVENLDDLDLDLGDMDLSDLLEEVAAEEAAVEAVAAAKEEPLPVAESLEESADLKADEDDASLDELAELDDLDLAEMMADLGVSEGVDLSDIDADLAALDSSLDTLESKAVPANPVEEELTANIVHDLDAELDSELQSLLDGSDGDIELEEIGADEEELADIDGWSLLDGADEVETKLDLARAYMDMEDADGARDILREIVQEGSETQQQEASVLLENIKL